MRAHVIENGVVVNTIEVDSLDTFPNLVEATDGSIGWNYDGTNFTNPNAFTQDELNAQTAEGHRITRDKLLADSDWTQMNDSPLSNEDKTAWATYRQELRDITDLDAWPNIADDDWPVKP